MLMNRETGKSPTADEMRAIKARASEIFASPYAAPEQLEWAMAVDPEGYLDAPPRYARA